MNCRICRGCPAYYFFAVKQKPHDDISSFVKRLKKKYFQLVIHLQEEESVEEIENPNTNSHILGQFICELYKRRVYRYMDEWYERNKDYQPRLYEALRLAKEMEEKYGKRATSLRTTFQTFNYIMKTPLVHKNKNLLMLKNNCLFHYVRAKEITKNFKNFKNMNVKLRSGFLRILELIGV